MVHRFVKLAYPAREIPSRTSWWNPLFDCKVEVKPVTWLQNVTIIPSRSHLFVRWSQSCSNCYFWSTQLQKVVPPGICWFTNPIKYRYMHHKPIVWIRCVASMSCKTYWCVVGNGGMRWLLIWIIPPFPTKHQKQDHQKVRWSAKLKNFPSALCSHSANSRARSLACRAGGGLWWSFKSVQSGGSTPLCSRCGMARLELVIQLVYLFRKFQLDLYPHTSHNSSFNGGPLCLGLITWECGGDQRQYEEQYVKISGNAVPKIWASTRNAFLFLCSKQYTSRHDLERLGMPKLNSYFAGPEQTTVVL